VIGAVATIGSDNLGGVNRSMSVYRVIAAMSLAASVAACTVGPDFVDPEMRVPAAFAFLAPARPSKTGVDPAQAQRIGSWWKTLHDAELNSLVERAVAANPDIEAALDRVQQAREREIAVLGAALPRVGAGGSVALGSGTDSVKVAPYSADVRRGRQYDRLSGSHGGRWLRRRSAAHLLTLRKLSAATAVPKRHRWEVLLVVD
jgi:outer membrane protein TolC